MPQPVLVLLGRNFFRCLLQLATTHLLSQIQIASHGQILHLVDSILLCMILELVIEFGETCSRCRSMLVLFGKALVEMCKVREILGARQEGECLGRVCWTWGSSRIRSARHLKMRLPVFPAAVFLLLLLFLQVLKPVLFVDFLG